MTTLIELKKELANIQDIMDTPGYDDKPECIKDDLFIRKTECKTAIAIAVTRMAK